MKKQQQIIEGLILMGAIVFGAGVLFKLTAVEFLYPPVVYWRFAIGCLALSMALSLQRMSR